MGNIKGIPMYLFLDDVRMPSEAGNYMNPVSVRPIYRQREWTIVRNYKQFVAALNKVVKEGLELKIVSFDHDLAEVHYDPSTWREGFKYEEETGYDCAKYMIEFCKMHNVDMPWVLVHSMNPVGKQNIQRLFDDYEKHKL